MSTKRNPADPAPVVTTIRLPKADLDWLRAHAARQERTVTAEIRFWLARERAEREAAA